MKTNLLALSLLCIGLLFGGCDKQAPEDSAPGNRSTETPAEEPLDTPIMPEDSGGERNFLTPQELLFPKAGGSVTLTADCPWGEFSHIVYNEAGTIPDPWCLATAKDYPNIKHHSFSRTTQVELEDGGIRFYKHEEGLRIPPSFKLTLGCEHIERTILKGLFYPNRVPSGYIDTRGYFYYGYLADQEYFIQDKDLWLCRMEADWFTCERKLEDWFTKYEKPKDVITERIPEGVSFLVDKPNCEYKFTLTVAPNPNDSPRTLFLECLCPSGHDIDRIVIRQE